MRVQELCAQVLVGLSPYNYLCTASGAVLADLRDLGDIVSWTNMARWAGGGQVQRST